MHQGQWLRLVWLDAWYWSCHCWEGHPYGLARHHRWWKRPKWMQKRFLPCSCKRCFCCKNKLTGKYGPPRKSPKKSAVQSKFVNLEKKRSSPRGRSKSKTPVLTKKAKKGGIVEVAADHVVKRVAIRECTLGCGVSIEEGRKEKSARVNKTDTDEKFLGKTKLGCPHLHCREHPVCQEHWEKFKHKWSDVNIHEMFVFTCLSINIVNWC